jgi:hypothetical protein
VNLSACIADVWYRLGFQNSIEAAAAGAWVTTSELYYFADEAVKRLARTTALFLDYDDSIAVVAGTAIYPQAASQVYTESAWLIGGQQLRITPVAALFALDQAYSLTFGPPARISFDAAGADFAVLYPTPTGIGTLCQILQARPGDGVPTLNVSLVLQDYFTNAMLLRARAKESDNAMPEVSDHLMQRLKMYEELFQQYWGNGR